MGIGMMLGERRSGAVGGRSAQRSTPCSPRQTPACTWCRHSLPPRPAPHLHPPPHTHTCTHKRIHTLGAGVFVTTGYVASHIAGPGVIISYIAAGISAALSSFVYAEVRSMC